MKDIKVLKSELRKGRSLRKAMMSAGYPENTANRGKAGLGKKMLRELLKSKIDLGGELTPDERARLIRGALVENVMDGKDSAVHSLKLLGADRELAMWQPEMAVGIIQVTAPEQKEELPIIEEIPLLSSGE